jgi:AsmA family
MKWKKPLRWVAIILDIVIVLAMAGGYVVMKSSWFHQYVLAKIIEEGQAATGGRLDVQNWNIHLSPLRAHLYGVVVHGKEPSSTKPLLEIQELTVGVSARSLLHRKLQLTELVIKRPVVNVLVAKNGENNIPEPPPSKTSSNTTVWNLAVGHTLLSNGEVYYNDKQIQLDADLYELTTEMADYNMRTILLWHITLMPSSVQLRRVQSSIR